jgi:GTP-binding protein
MRTQATDGDYRISTPPRVHTLESAIEFIAADELVEVTPTALRLRKRVLSAHGRRPSLAQPATTHEGPS